MMPVHSILLVIALVCFGLATIGWPDAKVNLVALGLFCWCLTTLV